MTTHSVATSDAPLGATRDAAPPSNPRRQRRPLEPQGVTDAPLTIEGWIPAVLLCALTLLLTSAIFPPVGAWQLAYICLMPWTIFICTSVRSRRVYFLSYALGVAFFAINAHWLAPVTFPGYVALCLIFGLAIPLAAWPVRHMYRRYSAPAAITLPIAWSAMEFLRGLTLCGFPWFYLAHSQYRTLTMLQAADLAGACGVSFVIAMVNGWTTDLLIQPLRIARRQRPAKSVRLPAGTFATLLVVAWAFLYGKLRLAEALAARRPGPRVAVLQQDSPLSVDLNNPSYIDPELGMEQLFALTRAAAERKPDLVVMPEGAWPRALNREFIEAQPAELDAIRAKLYPTSSLATIQAVRNLCRRAANAVRDLARETGATLAIGAGTIEWRADLLPERVERYNSAYVFPPDRDDYAGRYDKIHLVLFGEFVPFRYSPLHGVYEWLNRMTPWGAQGLEYSLSFGDRFERFSLTAASQGGRTFRFAAPICYEDVVSSVIRRFVGAGAEKQVDFLLSLSNDGWFNHSSELEQHLSASVLRAVEYRVPIARSVNTGISIFVDPTGEIHDRVRTSREYDAQFRRGQELLTRLRDAARLAGQRSADSLESDVRELAQACLLIERELPAALDAMSSVVRERQARNAPGVRAAAPAATAPQETAAASDAAASAPASAATESASSRPIAAELDARFDRVHAALCDVAAAGPRAAAAAAWTRLAEQAQQLADAVRGTGSASRERGTEVTFLRAFAEIARKAAAAGGPDEGPDRQALARVYTAWKYQIQLMQGQLTQDAASERGASLDRVATPLRHEYDYLLVRLGELLLRVANASADGRAREWERVAAQADADANTVARWRSKTATTPGLRVAELACDARQTLYAQWGDWFAWLCVSLTGLMSADWAWRRIRRPSRRKRREQARLAAAGA